MQDLKIRNQIKCVQNLARATRSPIHVEGDSNPMEVIEPIALEMTDSRATFKPV